MKNIKSLSLVTSLIISCFLSISVNAKTFKISSSAPDGTFWMKQMRAAAKDIKKQTDGRVKFKFYPGGVMGSETSVMKKIRVRQLHGAAVSHGILASFFPDSQIYGLPMLFNSYKEVDHVRKVFDQKIIDGLNKGGMVSFGILEGGFAYAMSTNAIEKTDDLLVQKIWAPNGNKQVELTLKSFGISPIPLNIGDVLTGLQTNLINTVAVSPIAAIALQWHTQIKYVTDIPLAYIYATLILDKKAFNKISKEDQKIVRAIMAEAFTRIDKKNREDNVAAFNALKNQGISIISPSKSIVADWISKGKIARETIKSNAIMSETSIKEMSKLLTDFRAQNKKIETLGAAR